MAKFGINIHDGEAWSIARETNLWPESSIGVVAEPLEAEMLLRFTSNSRQLVTAFETYAARGPGLPLVDCCIVEEAGLVPLLSNVYLLTVEWKRVEYACSSKC